LYNNIPAQACSNSLRGSVYYADVLLCDPPMVISPRAIIVESCIRQVFTKIPGAET